MNEKNFEEMIVNRYMTIHILTKAFGEQIEATLNIKCKYCTRLIFSDNQTFDMCNICADQMEDLTIIEEE